MIPDRPLCLTCHQRPVRRVFGARRHTKQPAYRVDSLGRTWADHCGKECQVEAMQERSRSREARTRNRAAALQRNREKFIERLKLRLKNEAEPFAMEFNVPIVALMKLLARVDNRGYHRGYMAAWHRSKRRAA